MKLRYFSHSACQIITDNNIKILIDPFLDNNPTSPVKSDDVEAQYIILTHAHNDHFGDAEKIAKRTGATFICVDELANYLESKGFKVHNMHMGGGHDFEFGRVKFTVAHHGSLTPDNNYAGGGAGVLVMADGKILYHTGDTALFSDMKLIGERYKVDYMLLPIGDNYTMDIIDAIKAVEFVNPGIAIPIHYNTWPVIEADPNEFKNLLEEKGKKCRVLDYGEEITL